MERDKRRARRGFLLLIKDKAWEIMKTKPLSPSQREKKRYLAFEVISGQALDKKSVFGAILKKTSELLGKIDTARAGVQILSERYNAEKQRGLIRVNHRYLEKLRATFCLLGTINNKKVLVRSLGASGSLKKAAQFIKQA